MQLSLSVVLNFFFLVDRVSRSASMVIAWLMARKGMHLEEALLFLRSKRPSVSPNEGFMIQLKL
jgi:protein-tyrosine phosphatase